MIKRCLLYGVLMCIGMLAMVSGVLAQQSDDPPAPVPIVVTEDEVNRISKRLFCPVCENIPLDACGTAACNDWRNEIRLYLEMGMTEDEIRADFVARFGDRVVGVPEDPFLRALTLVTPWILVGIAFFVVIRSFVTWQTHKASATDNPPVTLAEASSKEDNNPLIDLLEQDLKG